MHCFRRIQAGQYKDAHDLLNDLLKIEEENLGARTDKMADIYQLMSKTKSEVTAIGCQAGTTMRYLDFRGRGVEKGL